MVNDRMTSLTSTKKIDVENWRMLQRLEREYGRVGHAMPSILSHLICWMS